MAEADLDCGGWAPGQLGDRLAVAGAVSQAVTAVMAASAPRKAAEKAQHTFRTRLAGGEKANRKRMATIAVVYDATPSVRRPHDVIAPPGGYDTALAAGWPIASGAVEGACRHLIADRLAITGSRWSDLGAEAVLTLRAIISNGDFDEYWRFHRAQEIERVHPDADQHRFQLAV